MWVAKFASETGTNTAPATPEFPTATIIALLGMSVAVTASVIVLQRKNKLPKAKQQA